MQLYPILCDPINGSTTVFPVLHSLPEFAQTHVPLSQWCHPNISSSITSFSYCLQSFPASGSSSNESALHIRWPNYWSFSFSISPSSKYSGWFPLGWTGLISLLSRGLSRVFSRITVLFFFFFFSWRLITLQYCSGFCHKLTRISHGFTCIPHPDPLPTSLSARSLLGLPSAPGPSTCLMHPTWAGDLFHPR